MLTTTSFEDHVNNERQRLASVLKKAEDRKAQIDAEIAEINKELKALDAYDSIKNGKSSKTRKRVGWRKDVFEAIKGHPDGIERSKLLDLLSAKGNTARERSVNNAVTALKNTGKITSERGVYKPA